MTLSRHDSFVAIRDITHSLPRLADERHDVSDALLETQLYTADTTMLETQLFTAYTTIHSNALLE